MKALVSGGAGFVGLHLHSALAQRGYDVVNLDTVYGKDAMDLFLETDADLHGVTFDVVFHCAAFVKGRAGIDNQAAHLHSYNTMLDAAMFNWALHGGAHEVVYYSSSAAYPDECQDGFFTQPLTEDLITVYEPGMPEASYGQVKLYGEQMAFTHREAGLPVRVFRPFSGYGETQSLDYPFPTFIARAQAKADPFEIWGSGTQMRDWIHIDDIVEASIRSVEEQWDTHTLNLCTGVGTTFDEFARLCMSKVGYDGELRHLTDKAEGVVYRVGDPSALEMYYTPTITLEQGIERALAVD